LDLGFLFSFLFFFSDVRTFEAIIKLTSNLETYRDCMYDWEVKRLNLVMRLWQFKDACFQSPSGKITTISHYQWWKSLNISISYWLHEAPNISKCFRKKIQMWSMPSSRSLGARNVPGQDDFSSLRSSESVLWSHS
jgi:hypothetical protein